MTTRILAVSLVVAGIQGCEDSERLEPSEPAKAEQEHGVEVHSMCPPGLSFGFYFPPGTFEASEPQQGEFSVTTWYSGQLQAMGEPSLSCGEIGDSYRFTWLRSFDPAVAIRIDLGGATQKATLHAVELESAGGYEPGRVARRAQRELTRAELTKLESGIRNAALWSLPVKDGEPPGTDGSRWILESRVGNRYHIVDRWTPSSGPAHTLGLEFLELSGWRYENVY